jgi:hypothetical protein
MDVGGVMRRSRCLTSILAEVRALTGRSGEEVRPGG